MLAGAYPGQLRTILLANARDQRGALVQEVAASLGLEWRFLPPYAPHLNLMERWWKFVKKQGLYGTYSPESAAFQPAIVDCLAQAPTPHHAALASLLTLQFHTCKAVPIVGDQPPVVPFPVANRKRTAPQKISTKAA